MKLNLLPKSAARSVQSKKIMWIAAAAVLVSLAGAILYSGKVSGDLASWKQEAEDKMPDAEKVVATAAKADEIMEKAKLVLTNSALVDAIDDANKRYPALYDELKEYIPSFLRVRSLNASSGGAQNAVITIQGYLKTFQQYSDVMIGLLRFPGCSAVGRSGFGPVAAGDEGPFGYNPDVSDRGAIPGWSSVTLTMTVARDLRAPDPRPTLAAAGSGAPANTAPGTGG
jgi:hypothetical protein